MAEGDDAWFERQYNARAAVPDHPRYFERWREASRKARQEMPCYLDVAYGDSPGQTLDIFPARITGAPVLTFIHGGYWRSLDKHDFSFLARSFIPDGITLVLPNYDLCPEVGIETIVRQMLAAHAWIHRNARDYGADPGRITACGHSAGGHLTAMMLAASWSEYGADLPARMVRGGVAVSGVYDLMPLRRTSMNEDFRLDEKLARRLSPVIYRPKEAAALYTAVGGDESDEFKRQNALIAKCWQHCFRGDIALPGENHFSVVDRLADPAHDLHGMTVALTRAEVS